MRLFYKNTLLTLAIFLLALLMQSLRNGGVYLSEALPLGFWYAIGLTVAVLVGKLVLAYSR